jgi:hypothetical protein
VTGNPVALGSNGIMIIQPMARGRADLVVAVDHAALGRARQHVGDAGLGVDGDRPIHR